MPPYSDRLVWAPADVTGSGVDDDLYVARRVLPLEGGRNFRDLGGYRTRDGRRVRWGMLYRSGSTGWLTEADYDHLATLSIRSVCDLRTAEEREAEPNSWVVRAGIDYWYRDYKTTFGELRKVLDADLPTPEDARDAMMAGYRRLPFEQVPGYRAVFERLRDRKVPLMFNCTGGKDRAGTAAALILSALNVPLETIMLDYRLTDTVRDYRQIVSASLKQDEGHQARISPEVLATVMRTHPSYIRCALDAVVEKHGSIDAYLYAELGIDEADVQSIREMLLE